MQQAADFLQRPGISVVQDARLALRAGRVTAMHDPTEGGLAGALWELAEASSTNLLIDTSSILIPPLSQQICSIFEIDPWRHWLQAAAADHLPEDTDAITRHAESSRHCLL